MSWLARLAGAEHHRKRAEAAGAGFDAERDANEATAGDTAMSMAALESWAIESGRQVRQQTMGARRAIDGLR